MGEGEIRLQLLQQQQQQQNEDQPHIYSLWFCLRLRLHRLYYSPSYFCQTIKTIIHTVLVRPIQEMSILNRNTFFRIVSCLAFCTGMVTSGDQVLLLYYLEDQLNFNQQDVSLMFLIIG